MRGNSLESFERIRRHQAPGKDDRMVLNDPGRKSADILLSLPVELKERMVNTIT